MLFDGGVDSLCSARVPPRRRRQNDRVFSVKRLLACERCVNAWWSGSRAPAAATDRVARRARAAYGSVVCENM
eukprot:1844557-Prymnesium_polylepis.1